MESAFLKCKDILHLIGESEETLWTRRDASVSSEIKDIGSSILRECKCLKKTHDLFSTLDKRKCCLSLTNIKTSFDSSFRVVRNDGRDNGLEEGAMMKSCIDALPLVAELDEKEFRLFRYAYMCAAYPVLGAPDPPSPQTPPIQPVRRKFPDFKSQISQSKSESDIEDETSIVPAETLFELLRRVFRLSHNTFYEYEVYIRNLYGKKDAEPNRILAEEMVGQLASLENNSNPYYTPKNFITQFGYDRWQRKEFIHIAELMRKFWHMAHPHKRNNHIQFLVHVHDDYVSLMEKLLKYEAAYRQADNTQTTLLSSASVRLLKEFGLRYGVRDLFRRIVYLRYLVNSFDPSVRFLEHCIFGVSSVLEVLPNVEDMVRKELEILSDSIRRLQSTTLSTLSKMKNVFPDNKPYGGLEVLINLMDKILKAKVHLKMPKVELLDEMIVQCIKETFPPSYQQMKLVVRADIKKDKQGKLEKDETLSPSLLNMMIGKIRDEVNHYKTYYQGTFSRFCNVTEFVAQNLYTLFMEDLHLFLNQLDSLPPSTSINRQILGLGYRLHQLDQDWNLYIAGHPSSSTWREFFYKQSLHWLGLLETHLYQIVVQAVGCDRFTTQSFDDVGIAYQISISSVSSPRCRTTSLMSITPSINSAFSGLPSSNSTPVYNNIWNNTGNSSFQSTSNASSYHPKASLPIKAEHKFKHKYDTISLDETVNIDSLDILEDGHPFSFPRSCSSLPEKLSKSYDHYLSVSRKALSFSQHIENNKNNKNNKNGDAHERERTIAEKITFELSDHEDCVDAREEKEIEDILNDDDNLEDEHIDEYDNESIESDHSNDFSFPPLSEVSRNEDSDGLFTPPVGKSNAVYSPLPQAGTFSKIVEPTPVKSVPLVPSPLVNQREQLTEVKKPMPIRPSLQIPSKQESLPSVTSCSHKSSKEKKTAVLPVSGSVLDVVVILQRLLDFSQTLYQSFVLFTWQGRTFLKSSTPSQEMKRKMLETNLEMTSNTLHLYASNILCFDLCGTTNSEAKFLAGPMLIENLRTLRSKELIWGCRHNLSGEKDCFHYLNRKSELLSQRYEPVTKDMCTRVNNISLLLECMSVYHKKIKCIFINGQRQYPITNPDIYDTTDSPPLEADCRYLSHINRVQCRIMAYRVNLFVNDAIPVLLSLKQPMVPVDMCLLPLVQFLHSYLSSLQKWLYCNCYKMVLECLWIFIVRDFEREVYSVIRGANGSMEYSQLLIQAFTHLLKFMRDQKKTTRISLLLPEAEDVMFKLQLCATPTGQLIKLYSHVKEYYKNDESSDFTVQLILQKLRHDLLKYRKCFSGSELVKWIFNNQNLIKPLGFDHKVMNTDIATSIGRKFIEYNLICDSDSFEEHGDSSQDFDRSLEGIPENYPQLSIMENRQHNIQHGESTDSDDSQSTPRAPVNQSIRVLNTSNRSITPVRLPNTSSRSLKSPLHSFRERQIKNISIRSRDAQIACDTPLSFSAIFSDNDGPVFENSDHHFYHIATMTMLHETDNQEALTELDILLDQCFQCHVTEDFILHVIYSRSKIDSCARIFLQNQPTALSKKLKTIFDEREGCEIS